MSATQMLVTATMEFLQRYSPFNSMDAGALNFLAERVKLSYYAQGSEVVGPSSGIVQTFYIIQRGKVGVRVVNDQAHAAAMTHGPGEAFPIGSLTARRASNNTYTALDDVFCYELPTQDFLDLMHRSQEFNLFCTQYIAALLTQSRQALQMQFAQRAAEQQTMTSPLGSIISKTPVTATPETPVRQVLTMMVDRSIGSMVIVDAESKPTGIFTKSDVLKRIALPGLDLETEIGQVMSKKLFTLPESSSVYDAALMMALNGVGHLLVTDEGGVLRGVISERDLFTLQRVGLGQIRQAVEQAENLEKLKQVGGDVRQLALNMLAQGVGAEQLTRFISALNDSISRRVIELNLANHDLYGIQWAWLAFGSEGRDEQSFNTDQDNGIVYICPDMMNREELELRLLAFARDVNHDLDQCGFPLCKGNIMASNPSWTLTLEDWEEKFSNWIRKPAPDALLNASIFFDFRAIYGEASLAERLRLFMLDRARATPAFLRMMAQNAISVAPPLGRIRDFVTDLDAENPGMIDLKIYGSRLFIDAARIFALATGTAHANTVHRLRAVGSKLGISPEETAALIEGFNFIQLLRLRHQYFESEKGRPGNNLIDPDDLNDLERRILKEAFRQARRLQQQLKLDYQL